MLGIKYSFLKPKISAGPGPGQELTAASSALFQPVLVEPLQCWWCRLSWHRCQALKRQILRAWWAASGGFCCLCIPSTSCYVITDSVCVPRPAGGQSPLLLTVSRSVISWD